MRIGVDLDNTLVCCDDLFLEAAVSKGLVPSDITKNKTAVRDYLRRANRENEWTELQGYVYGALLPDAPAFPGCLDFLKECRRLGWAVFVISHKTLKPFLGTPYDLHAAAREWLQRNGFFATLGLSENDVFLELTKEKKLARIAATKSTVFIDDLPEFLLDPGFPAGVERILFDPQDAYRAADSKPLARVNKWSEILPWIQNSLPQ